MTIRWLTAQGYLADVVERIVRNGRMTRRFDLFDIIDILAVPEGTGLPVLAVQATTATNLGARVKKMRASPHINRLCLHWGVEAWGWRRYKKPDAQGRYWRPKIVVL